MDSNLLKEAIADAKAVRQTALANAKAALEEAFDNRLEAMFAPQLEEETADQVTPAPIATSSEPALEQEAAVNETDIDAIIKELESELPQDPVTTPGAPAPAPAPIPGALGAQSPPDAAPIPGAPAPAPAPALPVPPVDPSATAPVPPVPAPAPAPTPEDEMDEEIDVNELLESLKAEEEEENNKPWEKEKIDESVPVGSSDIATSDNKLPSSDARDSSHIEDGKKDKVGGGEGYKNGPEDPTKAKRPNQGKNVTKDNLSTPGGALKENTGNSTPGYPEGAEKTSPGDDASEAARPNEGPVTKDKMETPSLKKENVDLRKQLKEAEETLTYLRQQLNEINLLNAKLLYTSKLFKEYSMDNQKKMKIVELFDLAKNVREVKMTYTNIAESFNFGAEFKKKLNPSKVQNITEGMASKPIAGTAPDKQIIAENTVSDMKLKFQKLAGIKISNNNSKK